MCGIAGYWDQTNLWKDSEAKLKAADLALQHRGPDAKGLWFTEDKKIGFLHRRLAIIDLNERSTQPMISQSGKSVITFNGEIYNFLKIRPSFPNINWRTTSDTEVILEGLENEGLTFLKKLDGMFAFAHYHQLKKEILLAVDPFGKKPLYTYWDGKIFAFASEIKGLRAMGLPLEVCPEALSEYFLFGSPFGDKTVYKNIRRLLGGYSQQILNGIPQKAQPYWDLPLGQLNTKITYFEAEEQVQNLLAQAVQKRLMADVPIGCFLSGGLDSSAVAFEAQTNIGSNKLKTFSVGFPGHKNYDETRFAESVAKRIGSEHFSLSGTWPQAVEIDRILAHFDEPFPDSSLLPTFTLCKEVVAHAKVALSGDGGDEIFGGYRRMQAGLFTERWGGLLQILLKPLSLGAIKSSSPRSRLGFLLRLQSALQFPLTQRLLIWNSYFPEASLQKYLDFSWSVIEQKIKNWEELLQGHNSGQKILYFNAKTYLFSDLLPKVDRMSMYHGLEVRSPFLDKQLSEFVFTLPTNFKFTNWQTKRILKDVYRKYLGSDIVDRKKQGFATPLHPVYDWKLKAGPSLSKLQKNGLGDLNGLLDSQIGTAGFETCTFSMWAAAANLDANS